MKFGGNSAICRDDSSSIAEFRAEFSNALGLLSLSAPRQNADHFARIGTGHEAAPVVGVGKTACVQVVNGFGDPSGAANQQDPHLLLVGCQGMEIERQNYRQGANFALILILTIR